MIERHKSLEAKKQTKIVYREISPITPQKFRDTLTHVDWQDVTALSDATEAYEKFLEIFKTCYFAYFPLKTLQHKKFRKPWVTRENIRLLNEKFKLYRSFLQSQRPSKRRQFKTFRNKLTKISKQTKSENYSGFFGSTCLQNLQKKLNTVKNPNKGNDAINSIINGNDKIGGNELADHFNDVFVDIGKGAHIPEDAAVIPRLRESIFIFAQPK